MKKNKSPSLKKALKKYRVNSSEILKPPEIAWGMISKDKNNFIPLGTLGNFSLIIGKAKSKKSFFIGLITSTILKNNKNLLNHLQSRLPKGKEGVLYFDTEQGKYHVQLVLKRICKQINIKNPKHLKMYGLRSLNPKERLDLIEFAIYKNDDIGFVVIDGIKDLITSINSEEEATGIASKLLKWSEERNIHIVCVLHQNKGDNNARGHLGSELVHKAETVLSVSKSENDKNISVVEAEMCRNEEPDIFAFEIIDGLPIQVEDYEERAKTKKKKYDVLDIPHYQMYQLLTEVYSFKNEYKYAELMIAIKTAHKKQLKKPLADIPARDLIIYMKNMNWLIQEKERMPYKLGKYETKTD
ncbi:AAA family ATPase [Mariniflexile gromovii]|uniref:AAA family ATPase n=1 Tax=Mariniflexile gromovii TaxID=362523 RepID=A0ABS4BSI6_9FLAO|nr:AAA family ATPase [Mariniflexile gromovii]MBP0903558.1 AAA family ATPase [Mariniflexile gromovii]